MPFKFEQLDVWRAALEYVDLIYQLAGELPRTEDFNLRSQITRAATSIALNIAEGSTGQTDAEQARFRGLAIRSLPKTVACQHIIRRRALTASIELLRTLYQSAEVLAAQLHSMHRAIAPGQIWIREDPLHYEAADV